MLDVKMEDWLYCEYSSWEEELFNIWSSPPDVLGLVLSTIYHRYIFFQGEKHAVHYISWENQF